LSLFFIQRRVTYTPRTILFDLKENVNILRLADSKKKLESESSFNWSGQTQIFKEKKNETSQFINNLEKVNYSPLNFFSF